MRSRLGSLLNLLVRRLWWLVAGVILGALGVTQTLRGAIHQGYLLALGAVACLVIALGLVAYQLLSERDEALSERDEAKKRASQEATTIITHHHHYAGESGPTFVEADDAKGESSGDSTT